MYPPLLISSNQTAYVQGRFVSNDRRLFSDILQVIDFLKSRGWLEKAFDSVNYRLE